MKPTQLSEADVYVRDERAGKLERLTHGARFAYDPAYLARHQGAARAAVAFSLPLRSAPYEVFGVNLHPFFAGLLPEGLRLRALVRASKTSEDDLFTLLVAAGADTIGAVRVAQAGSEPLSRAPLADVRKLSAVSFRALLEQSLAYGKSGGDFSIAGVQPKVSAAMLSFPLRSRSRARSYILKLNPADYPRLVQNELFFMEAARTAGIESARVKLVSDESGEQALLVERFDRVAVQGAGKGLYELAQEDGCQLLGRYPADKYRITLSELAQVLELASSASRVDILRLLTWQAFSYLIANGDMHAKNVSVRTLGSRVELTPAYDLLSTLPYGDDALALSMDGRDRKLRASHFIAFGARFAIPEKATTHMLAGLVRSLAPCVVELGRIGLDAAKMRHLERTMSARLAQLSPG